MSDRTPRHGLPRPLAAVTFDCWQTLLVERDWDAAHALRVEALAEVANGGASALTVEAARRAFDEAWHEHMQVWLRGESSGAEEIARSALLRLGRPGRGAALDALVSRWQEASHSGRVEALVGARRTLARLVGAGVRCALVCDTGLTPGRVVRQHLGRHGLLEHLESCSFSDEVGVPKPDARAFRAALEPLGVPPAAALHVGDLRRTDVAGARALGMATVRLRATHDDATGLPDADFVVDSHEELLGLLDPEASP